MPPSTSAGWSIWCLRMADGGVWYNEIDPFAADWLEQLIQQGHIAPGVVDRRSIVDVKPSEIAGYRQCHFFAGIGVWSYALRLAGWRDDRAIWTGSCPCQPFSSAGKGSGFDDERHLWPHFHYLIEQCRPSVVVGEQVASKDGLAWLDLVQADMEGTGYAFGAVNFCAAGVGAPHIRQRLYWVGEGLDDTAGARRFGAVGNAEREARDETRLCVPGLGKQVGILADPAEFRRLGRRSDETGVEPGTQQRSNGFRDVGGMADTVSCDGFRKHGDGLGSETGTGEREAEQREWIRPDPTDGFSTCRMADADRERCGRQHPRLWIPGSGRWIEVDQPETSGGSETSRMANANDDGQRTGGRCELHREGEPRSLTAFGVEADRGRPTGPTNGFWSAADWLRCRDERWRPVEPGTFPLAHGAAARVGRLRGYGNAINAQQAKAFIEALDDRTHDITGTAHHG